MSALSVLGLTRSGFKGVLLSVAATTPMAIAALTSLGRADADLIAGNAVIGPLAEELLFRGFLFGSLVSVAGWRVSVAIATSAFVFGLAHIRDADMVLATFTRGGHVLDYGVATSGNDVLWIGSGGDVWWQFSEHARAGAADRGRPAGLRRRRAGLDHLAVGKSVARGCAARLHEPLVGRRAVGPNRSVSRGAGAHDGSRRAADRLGHQSACRPGQSVGQRARVSGRLPLIMLTTHMAEVVLASRVTLTSVGFAAQQVAPVSPAGAAFAQGVQLHDGGKPADAIALFKQAIDLGYQPANQARFRLARAYARAGNTELALVEFEVIAAAGFANTAVLSMNDLDGLRALPRFKAFESRVNANARPCDNDPRFHAFDFWIGEWDVQPTGNVRAPTGQGATSVIEAQLGGCVIQENWMPNGPVAVGKSFNIYNTATKLWEQVLRGLARHRHALQGRVQGRWESLLRSGPARAPGTRCG